MTLFAMLSSYYSLYLNRSALVKGNKVYCIFSISVWKHNFVCKIEHIFTNVQVTFTIWNSLLNVWACCIVILNQDINRSRVWLNYNVRTTKSHLIVFLGCGSFSFLWTSSNIVEVQLECYVNFAIFINMICSIT